MVCGNAGLYNIKLCEIHGGKKKRLGIGSKIIKFIIIIIILGWELAQKNTK